MATNSWVGNLPPPPNKCIGLQILPARFCAAWLAPPRETRRWREAPRPRRILEEMDNPGGMRRFSPSWDGSGIPAGFRRGKRAGNVENDSSADLGFESWDSGISGPGRSISGGWNFPKNGPPSDQIFDFSKYFFKILSSPPLGGGGGRK